MKNNETFNYVHKHVLATFMVIGLAFVFGLVIYPKIAIPAQTPSAPTRLEVAVGEEEALITWAAPLSDGGLSISGYSINYYPVDDPKSPVFVSVDSRTFRYPLALIDLNPGARYIVNIFATNSDGDGEEANTAFDVPDVLIPSAPEGCMLDAGDSEVVVVCSAPRQDGGAPISSFLIYYGEVEKGEYSSIEVSSDKDGGLSATVTSLTNNVEYNFYFVAKNSNDVVGESTEIMVVTPVGGDGGPSSLEIVDEPTVTTTSTTATIHWTTNREASSIVYYGPTEDIKGVSPEQNTTPRVSNHQTQITGLVSCMTYWFKSESFDADGNSVQSLGGEFTTKGCKGDSSIVVSDVKVVTPILGATASAKVSGKGIQVVVPAAIKNGFDVAIEASKLEQEKVASAISSPVGKSWVGDNAYSLKALEDEITEVAGNFDRNVSVSIDYTDDELSGFSRSTLKIYHYEDATGWMPLNNCINDYDSVAGTGTVTCNTSSFSVFGLFGEVESSSGGNSSGSRPTQISTDTPSLLPDVTGPNNSISPHQGNELFVKDLSYEMVDPDVKKLQVYLNSKGFMVAGSGYGSVGNETEYFGPLTRSALIKFQEKYRAEILTPLGLVNGTGFFGEKTRAFINSNQ